MLCTPETPTETEPEQGFSVSCRGSGQQRLGSAVAWVSSSSGQQRPATESGALGAADLGMA